MSLVKGRVLGGRRKGERGEKSTMDGSLEVRKERKLEIINTRSLERGKLQCRLRKGGRRE